MPSRRDQIKMTDEEVREFLAEQMIMSCATIGPHGRPHLIALWYVPDGTTLTGWTYAKSQKAKNLERDPRATVQVEDGVQYHELRGAMLECDVELERDTEKVADIGMTLFGRYAGGAELPDGTRDVVLAQAPKRVGLRFVPTRVVTWDHSKLGGVY
jgi:PPOX class probable F420-dependent enzyme